MLSPAMITQSSVLLFDPAESTWPTAKGGNKQTKRRSSSFRHDGQVSCSFIYFLARSLHLSCLISVHSSRTDRTKKRTQSITSANGRERRGPGHLIYTTFYCFLFSHLPIPLPLSSTKKTKERDKALCIFFPIKGSAMLFAPELLEESFVMSTPRKAWQDEQSTMMDRAQVFPFRRVIFFE
jgi:hypothetical protein